MIHAKMLLAITSKLRRLGCLAQLTRKLNSAAPGIFFDQFKASLMGRG